MEKKSGRIESLSDRHFNWIKWGLTALSTIATTAVVQLLHAGGI